jgi:hypothetical protein
VPNHPRSTENNTYYNAEKALERRLRGLGRNMSAISEGSGNPHELVEEIVKVAESLIAYNEAYGTRPHEALIRRALTNLQATDD